MDLNGGIIDDGVNGVTFLKNIAHATRAGLHPQRVRWDVAHRGPNRFQCHTLHVLNLGTNVLSPLSNRPPARLQRGSSRNLLGPYWAGATCNTCKRLKCGNNTSWNSGRTQEGWIRPRCLRLPSHTLRIHCVQGNSCICCYINHSDRRGSVLSLEMCISPGT